MKANPMKWDFGTEKIISAVIGVAVYFLATALDAPYWLALVALIFTVGWGPDFLRYLRR